MNRMLVNPQHGQFDGRRQYDERSNDKEYVVHNKGQTNRQSGQQCYGSRFESWEIFHLFLNASFVISTYRDACGVDSPLLALTAQKLRSV